MSVDDGRGYGYGPPVKPRISAPTPSGRRPDRVADVFRMKPPARTVPRDERGYSFGPPTVESPQKYLSEAYSNALLGSEVEDSYDPFAILRALFGDMPGGGGGSRGGGGGGGAGVNRAAVNDAIKAMTEANTASQGRVGQLFSGANTQLADMANRYAAAQQALAQGAGQTLGAFGVTGQQMNPLGMSAGDYLTSSQGLLTGLSAAQQAQMEAQRAAYQLILADMLKAGG
jgi:hypothetical protein